MIGNNSLGEFIRERIPGRTKIVSVVGPDISLMASGIKTAGTA